MRRRSFLAGLVAVVTAFKAGRNPFEEAKKFKHVTYAKGFSISNEVLQDDAHAHIETIMTDMGDYWRIAEYTNDICTRVYIRPKQPGSIQFSIWGGGSAHS